MLTRLRHATATRVRLLALALCIGAGTSCAPPSPPTSSWPVVQKPSVPTVVVRNHHSADLRIYVVVPDGGSHRLGIVSRFGAATLILPRAIHLPAELRFVAMPLGHDEPQVTEPIFVDVGTSLVFTVENDPPASSLMKRP